MLETDSQDVQKMCSFFLADVETYIYKNKQLIMWSCLFWHSWMSFIKQRSMKIAMEKNENGEKIELSIKLSYFFFKSSSKANSMSLPIDNILEQIYHQVFFLNSQ